MHFACNTQHFAPGLSPKVSPNTARATKSDTPTSPNIAPATKSYIQTSLQQHHQILRLPQKVTALQLQQILCLPRKVTHESSLPFSSLLSSTLLFSTLPFSTRLFSTLLFSSFLYSTLITLLYSSLLFSTLLFSLTFKLQSSEISHASCLWLSISTCAVWIFVADPNMQSTTLYVLYFERTRQP